MEAPKPGNLVFAAVFTEGASVIHTPQQPLRSDQTEKGCGEGWTGLGRMPRSATTQRRGEPGPRVCQAELGTPSADPADTDFKLKPPAENLESLSDLPTCLKAAKSTSHKGVEGQDTRPWVGGTQRPSIRAGGRARPGHSPEHSCAVSRQGPPLQLSAPHLRGLDLLPAHSQLQPRSFWMEC